MSVYECSDAQDVLRAMIYEVTNTFDESCRYVVDAAAPLHSIVSHRCTGKWHASPFAAVAGRSNFRIIPPADSMMVGVVFRIPEGPLSKNEFSRSDRVTCNRDATLAGPHLSSEDAQDCGGHPLGSAATLAEVPSRGETLGRARLRPLVSTPI